MASRIPTATLGGGRSCKHPKRPRNVNQLARAIVDVSVGAAPADPDAALGFGAHFRWRSELHEFSKKSRFCIAFIPQAGNDYVSYGA